MSSGTNSGLAEGAASGAARPMDPELVARLTRARDEEAKKQNLRARVIRERRFLIPVFLFVLLLFPNFGRAKVVGRSMEPQFHDGDPLVVLKTYRIFSPLKVGDIIVMRKKTGEIRGEDIVKRVVFVQNAEGTAPFPETVAISRGQYRSEDLFPWWASGETRVPAGGIIVLGDNIEVSQDSRDAAVGVVQDEEVVGKVLQR